MEDLTRYRNEIDNIDKELIQLFEKRMNTVLEIARHKMKNNTTILQKDREEKVLSRAVDNLDNKAYSQETIQFFNSIMEISRGLQKRLMDNDSEQKIEFRLDSSKKKFDLSSVNKYKSLKEELNKKNILVGFPGKSGSFTKEALNKFFNKKTAKKQFKEFEDVFIALKNKKIDYGIIPIENSSTGAISETYDLLRKYGFYIVGEECIKIDQNLIGIKDTKLKDIKEIYSHPQGIGQCSEFLKQNSAWKLIPFNNTATSAELVKKLQDKTKAAIASKKAASIYGLEIISPCINDITNNYTRFVVISNQIHIEEESNKMSVVFSVEHKAGKLYKVLGYFAENNINMTKIESRPMKNTSWRYFFYIDFECSIYNSKVYNLLELIELNTAYFKFMGVYKNKTK
ncbi:bifunctional P-protein, chorismate mutase/prephenate dehydratase [Clostridioides difficile]|uniref:prephenate dehydratase n=1 Tax=Clostridioides difficile TaxID=1496 RepID=UPI0010B362F7|nr:bifunctional P-protein, chorismate mutase/prephenate dehydratase [Clostridioides difficile]VIG24889.1 bifunctional P-protein, chorismate mutase/prephenate dehydratase [Clostridioides difficile]VII01226.1 bifunctional P-protein, chorismate mutase/prephenate dehydratase [Clostridioides difficile]VIN48554.1 bifunctional P-protein, chorismate mutase/prephenate dehydratase [Clostridioides difficile]HAU5233964.1 prephenate dehydratase [Clostridioides difficile]